MKKVIKSSSGLSWATLYVTEESERVEYHNRITHDEGIRLRTVYFLKVQWEKHEAFEVIFKTYEMDQLLEALANAEKKVVKILDDLEKPSKTFKDKLKEFGYE